MKVNEHLATLSSLMRIGPNEEHGWSVPLPFIPYWPSQLQGIIPTMIAITDQLKDDSNDYAE